MPVMDATSTAEDYRYLKLVQEQQVHKCYSTSGGCTDNKDGICSRGYMSNILHAESCFDCKGYPVYRRPTTADLLVAVYYIIILVMHINNFVIFVLGGSA